MIAVADKQVRLPYKPRKWAIPFHARRQRFSVMCLHRRAGKTEACIYDLVNKALKKQWKETRPHAPPRYAYVAPLRSQAKDVVWERLKNAVAMIPDCKISESELSVKLPNGALIRLYGADNPDSLRGNYLDGVVLDEFGDMKPEAYNEVIRVMLSDYNGWVVFIGTPKGKNDFYKRWLAGKDDQAKPEAQRKWFWLTLKASESGIISTEEIAAMKEELDEDDWQQELECSFDAAVRGTFYAKQLNEMEATGQLEAFQFVKSAPVHMAFDLGYEDATACWFFQVLNGRLDVVDHWSANHLSIAEITEEINARAKTMGYRLGNWWLPHDAKHKSVQTGKTIVELLQKEGVDRSKLKLVPDEKVYQGIQAVRATLPAMRIHGTNCYDGLEALKSYRKKFNTKLGSFSKEAVHDWASHSADAMRYLCLAVRDEDIEKSAVQKLVQKTAAEIRAEWVEKNKINTKPPSYCLDDIWDTAPNRGGYIRI